MIRRQPSISWLKSVVADHGPFVDVESKASPVRVFSFPFSFNDLPAVRTFNCNHSLGKKEKILDDEDAELTQLMTARAQNLKNEYNEIMICKLTIDFF